MDAAYKSNRKYPSYTLSQLESAVAEGRGNPIMEAEIFTRKSGASVVFSTPQIEGGKPAPKLGRM